MSAPTTRPSGDQASLLVRQLIDEHDPRFGIGSMSCSIYDTAWVSMVSKITDSGQTEWLFPESFHYLLNQQQHDGGWMVASSETDSILNTLAALLAICRHIGQPDQITSISLDELERKKDRAVYFLEAKFSQWEVPRTAGQCSELLILKHLQLLEDQGITFGIPSRHVLVQRREKKATRYHPEALYRNTRNPMVQFLEGFVGDIEFDRLKHHKISGSMMASPAATAAYLQHSSEWDAEAEAYLDHVVVTKGKAPNGGVPSRYPNTVHEISTIVSILLDNGFNASELSEPYLKSAASFLEDCLALERGVTGFAPHVQSDAINTARALSALGLMGRMPATQGFLEQFQTKDYFKTHAQDRKPDFYTNCCVLKALLDLPSQLSDHSTQIEKVVKYLVSSWWTTNGQIEDETNTSANRPILAMTQAFSRLIETCDQGRLSVLDNDEIKHRVFLCLFQALTRLLQTQNRDGSWGLGPRCEATAYAVLSLSRMSSFTSTPQIKKQVLRSIEIARNFLSKNFQMKDEPDYVTTEKTAAGCRAVYQAYILAALRSPIRSFEPGHTIEGRFTLPVARIVIQTKYFGRQPWFAAVPAWEVQAFLVQNYLFLPQLRLVQYAVFPQEVLGDDQHFDMIPFAFIAAASVEQRNIGPEFLFQMMIMLFLNRQLQEYVSNVLCEVFAGCMFEVEDMIHSIFEELKHFDAKDQCFCDHHTRQQLPRSSISTSGTISLSEARSVLYRYISHVSNHPYVLMASHHDQEQLRCELLGNMRNYLARSSETSEAAGIEDNALARTGGSSSPDQSCHQLMFAFLSCIVGNQAQNGTVGLRRDFVESPEHHYLVADICRRLSIISFMSLADLDRMTPEAPYKESEPSPHATTFGSSSRNSSHSALSSASATSSSYSDSLSSLSPVSSVSSAPDQSPIRDSHGKDVIAALYSAPTSPQSEHIPQLRRLLSYERRCLNVCLESLAQSDLDLRSLNIVKTFIDSSEVSQQVLNDPNVGISRPDVTDGIEIRDAFDDATWDLDPVPAPPKRSQRRGSVSAARAALEVAPLQPGRHTSSQFSTLKSGQSFDDWSRTPSILSAAELQFYSSQDDIKLTGVSERQREWNLNMDAKKGHGRDKTSTSTAEIERIENIMREMEGASKSQVNLSPRSERTPVAALPVVVPEPEHMLPIHPALRQSSHQLDLNRHEEKQGYSSDEVQASRSRSKGPTEARRQPTPARSRPNETKTQYDDERGRRHGSASRNPEGRSIFEGAPPPLPSKATAPSKASGPSSHPKEFVREMTDDRILMPTPRRATIAAPSIITAASYESLPRQPRQQQQQQSPTINAKPRRAHTSDDASSVETGMRSKKMNIPARHGSAGQGKAAATAATAGWIQAPPPTSYCNRSTAAATTITTCFSSLEAEDKLARVGKLKRASRLGGPRWRAPF